MNNEQLNSLAYDDILNRLPPSLPDNEIYMSKYRFWKDCLPEYEKELF